jgi:ADP-ribose pyrophosphatase YjhB (NUDIX family)
MNQQAPMARDREEFKYSAGGQDWITSWHPPALPPPSGKLHGSAAVCLTSEGNIVLVSSDSQTWNLPGGRPEGDEDWRMTLEREVLEEACAQVKEASLLGFSKGVCVRGHEKGLVLVRALWRAVVSLHQWEPHHEISHRLIVPSGTALTRLLAQGNIPVGLQPIYRRWFHEVFLMH